MRWTRSITLTVVALAAGAAGCTTAPGTAPWPPPAAGLITITVLSGTDTSISPGSPPLRGATGIYSELVDWWNTYEEPLTGIRVQLDTIDGGATLEHGEMLAAAQAGDASYDVYNLDNEWVSEFAAGGYIRSLQGTLPEGGFLRQPLASGGVPPGGCTRHPSPRTWACFTTGPTSSMTRAASARSGRSCRPRAKYNAPTLP